MADERVVTWLGRRTALVDTVAAGTLLVACLLIGLLVGADRAYFAFSLGLIAPLAFRRRRPELVAVAVAAVALLQWAMVRDTTGALLADLAVPIVIYTLADRGSKVASRIGLAAGLIGAGLGGWSWPQLSMPVVAHVIVGGFLAGTVLAAWLAGAWQRARRGELTALAERAALLEQTREQETRLAVMSERTRIARDIHDILAHSLAVIVAQADGGRYAAPEDPAQAVASLRAIGEQGRRALTETRRAIGVLREDAENDPDPAPRVGISDIERLVADVRASGLAVELRVAMPDESLDPGVGLVVYRIVQEGLTNAVKHAGVAARVHVSIRHVEDWLHVDVSDDGGHMGGDRSGYGGHERADRGDDSGHERTNRGDDCSYERAERGGNSSHQRADRGGGSGLERSGRGGDGGGYGCVDRSGDCGHGRVERGDGALPAGGGYGLIGMRERVGVYGGELELRRHTGGSGHLLAARIPMRSGGSRR